MKERKELENKLREKTHIGIKHHCGNSFGGEYFEQELLFNGEPDDIWINDVRYNDVFQKQYQRIVDLLHQILIEGSHLREDNEIGEFGEENEWYEWLDSEASIILDILNE